MFMVSHISLLDLSIISRLIWIHQVQDNIFQFLLLLRSYTYWHKFPTFGSGARGQDELSIKAPRRVAYLVIKQS